jgi:hypothetical protein
LVIALAILAVFINACEAMLDSLAKDYLWAAKIVKRRNDGYEEHARRVIAEIRVRCEREAQAECQSAAYRATWPKEYRGEP